MSHLELMTIDKKIEQTRAEIQSLSSCTDASMQAIMTIQLENRLQMLLQQKEEMISSTAKDTVTLRIYGDNVQTGRISSRVLLSALNGFQSMLDSVANAMLHSPTSRGKIPERIKDATSFEIVDTFAGSFGIVLEKQNENPSISTDDNEINKILSEMFSVLETVDDSEQLLSLIAPFGKRTVMHYRQWLDDLQENGVNLELNWKNDSAASRRMHLIKEKAPSIISTLDTIDTMDHKDINICGMLNGINIRNRTFEMSTDEYGLVKGTAMPETLMSILEKIGTSINANIIKSTSYTKAGVEKVTWFLSSTN